MELGPYLVANASGARLKRFTQHPCQHHAQRFEIRLRRRLWRVENSAAEPQPNIAQTLVSRGSLARLQASRLVSTRQARVPAPRESAAGHWLWVRKTFRE